MWFPRMIPRRVPPCDRRIGRCLGAAGVIVALGLLATPCAAADGSPAYTIACRVELERDPALTPVLERELREHAQKIFQAVLGSDHRFRFLPDDDADPIPRGSLHELSVDQIVSHWPSEERLLLLRLGRQANSFVLQAREYDPQFQTLGPLCESRTIEREMVPSTVGRVLLQAFTPIAEVRSATGTNVQIEFRAGSRLRAYRPWLGLDREVGLQVMSEPIARGGSGGEHATRYRRSFLVLRNWESDRAECELVGPDGGAMFQKLGTGGVRFLARPARGSPAAVRVNVVCKDGRQPHEGCEVFVSPQQYSTDAAASRGITDSTGTVRFDAPAGGVQFVSVRYEDLVLKAPLLAGASADPLVFELQTRGRRAEFVRPLRQLLDEIDDQYRVDLRLREDLKVKAEAKDTAELRKLVERGRQQRITLEEVEKRTREAESRARSDGEDVSALAAFVRESADKKVAKQFDKTLAEFSAWADRLDKKNTIDEILGRINDRQKAMDWPGLVPLYERLVEVAPDNKEFSAELRRLQNNLKTKSPEHERARTFVESDLPGITSRNLDAKWQEIDQNIHALLGARDHLTLLKARRSMSAWSRELGQEVKGLVDQIQAAGQDEDRVAELRERLERLDELNKSLVKLFKEVQQFLEKLEL